MVSLIVGGALAAAGIAANAIANAKASEKTAEARRKYTDYYNTEYYRNPADSLGTKAILKLHDERRRDELDALNNRAVAGGATMENQLAARKMLNQSESEFESQLLLQQDAKRQALDREKLGADQQNSLQDAQNWQAWGANMSSSLMSAGSLAMLGGGSNPLSSTPHGGVRPANVPLDEIY